MNKTENIIKYQELGEIRYVRNRKARNLAIRIGRKRDVRVTVPGYVSMRRAEEFVFSKSRWILQKIQERERFSAQAISIADGGVLEVNGKQITVRLRNEQDSIEEAIWRILHEEAASSLRLRVEELAREHGLSYSGVKVRRMKTRWGSCNAKNGINLNSWLVMLPAYLADYVILHELAHTRHRDHGPRFWAFLDSLTSGTSKQLRKELRAQQIMLIDTE